MVRKKRECKYDTFKVLASEQRTLCKTAKDIGGVDLGSEIVLGGLNLKHASEDVK